MNRIKNHGLASKVKQCGLEGEEGRQEEKREDKREIEQSGKREVIHLQWQLQ